MTGPGRARRRGELRGNTSPIIVLLLSGILVALVVLIAVLVTQKPASPPPPDPNRPKEPGVPSEPPKRPKPIGDPARIRELLQLGKTYRVVVKGTLKARVEDKRWATKQVINLAYAAEMAVDRTVESNDGHTVVERRHFVTMRNAKILCDVEDFSISLGPPGVLLLGGLEYVQPGAGATVAVAKPIVEALLGPNARKIADSEATKVVASVNGLSGKTVRITYVDGEGVKSVDPVDCTLTDQERDYLLRAAVLSDGYLLPDRKSKPGDTWTVDGAQLAGFLDPTLSGFPDGEVVVTRGDDEMAGEDQVANLRIDSGLITINGSDHGTRRMGKFSPRGTLKYSITRGFVEAAHLKGQMVFERIARDHILFETSFRTRPDLVIDYACNVR